MASVAPIANTIGSLGIPLTKEGADQIHSINIGGYNTWTTFHLIPKERPMVTAAEPKLDVVEIPGSDTPLDYTQSIDGKVHYKMRSGSWDFIAPPDGNGATARQSQISRAIDHQRVAVTLNDDPTYYYVGRVWLSSWRSGKDYAEVTLKYQLEPYKIHVNDEGNRLL